MTKLKGEILGISRLVRWAGVAHECLRILKYNEQIIWTVDNDSLNIKYELK